MIDLGRSGKSAALVAVVLAGLVLTGCDESMNARYNRETVEVMRRVMRPDSTGVDVGAYIGELLEPMVEIAPKGRHYAFEPQVEHARALARRFRDVLVFDVALGETRGRQSFVLALDAPARSGFKRREYPPGEDRTRDMTVEVRRLDDIVPATAPVAFIKVDVEGGEFLVLRGARATIARHRPVIVFEFGLGSAEGYGSTPERVWDFMQGALGLRLWLMSDWLEGRPPLSSDDFRAQFYGRSNYMFLAAP
ncbi:MAG: FkbM family methyltransferase [Vicinamibacteria bacterium]|nr:FkbM family methyltransferase [Vicinamibacteria bacterium]